MIGAEYRYRLTRDVTSTSDSLIRGDDELLWEDIPQWPGYRVCSDGSVWSCRTSHGQIGSVWRSLRPRPDKDGYLSVTLQWNGERRTAKVAHLVLGAFVGPRPDGAVSRHHPDPDPTNNRADNLLWGTQAENIGDKVSLGRQARGEGHGLVKLTDAQVADIRARYVGGAPNGKPASNARELAAEYDVTPAHIGALVKEKYRATS